MAKIIREMIALPIMWAGIVFLVISFKVGGYDFGASFIETIKDLPFKRINQK